MDKELNRILDELRKEIGKASPKLLPLIDKFIESCSGGKRLRGKLVILGYQLAHLPGVRAHLEGEIAKVAAAYEIMHSAILAHDDIIDQSPFRRGKPSLYKAVGASQAITLADLGFFLAIRIIAESKFSEKEKNEALKLFSQTMVDTAIGQMLDIQKGDVATVRKLKTARYTVAGPLQLGAILAGASHLEGAKAHLRGDLVEFGENLGIAFQIKDDILDGEAKDKDLANALKYMDQARKMIPRITGDPNMRKQLNELVDYTIERTK